jgi:hypothetical protein
MAAAGSARPVMEHPTSGCEQSLSKSSSYQVGGFLGALVVDVDRVWLQRTELREVVPETLDDFGIRERLRFPTPPARPCRC